MIGGGEGIPWVVAFGGVEGCVGVNEEDVIFLLGAKGCEEIAEVVEELLARVGVRNVLHG